MALMKTEDILSALNQRSSPRDSDPSETERPSRKGRILRVKLGYNPNSSSIGTILFAIPATLLAAGAVLGAVMGFLHSSLVRPQEEPGRESGESSELADGPKPQSANGAKESEE
jgi:hypothetical protein